MVNIWRHLNVRKDELVATSPLTEKKVKPKIIYYLATR